MDADIARVLLTAEEIAARVEALAREIAADLDRIEGEAGLVLVPVLTGSIVFVADLMRRLPVKLRIGVTTVSSYPGRSTASQGAELRGAIPGDLGGRHVLIVDDILDSGRTLRLLRDVVRAQDPASVRTCVLLRKPTPGARETPCEYVGFDIPDEFVVGYGLDYDDHYRNLPYVGVLRPEAM
ncbi:MAG TPA: hypoxanthine phosphoribosyltransferase [Phycisphaerales bacterium]|nr:hypoxanthine phosphoribosyltransferase [Phycisphaerales bacterium]HMP36308.1 hypoxanthine phosphoribosyltransferase [Phycisphaerales bacterium]